MKTIFKYVASLSVMLLAVSCALTEIDTQMTAEQAIAAIRLDCSAEQQYNIPADRAQVITFQVTSTTPWSISSPENPDWLTFSPVSSAVSSLKEDIRVSVTANPGFEDRIATLVVTGENTQKSHTITIKQLRNGRFEFTPATGDIPASGSAVTFTVTTNLDWTVEAEDAWLVIDKASGEGKDGVAQTISLSAAANNSISRDTKVNIKAGEFSGSFKIKQKGGVALDFILEGEPEVDRLGVEPLLIGVDAVPWTLEIDNPAFTAEKVSDTQIKVTAPYNGKFIQNKAKLTIKPTDASMAGLSRSLEIVQDMNFRLSGEYEVLEDGSVKLKSSAETRITSVDDYRFASVVVKMGDRNFEDKGQMWCTINAADCNIYNQITLGGNIRVRTDGNLPNAGTSTYNNAKYTITKADLNAMTEYRFDVIPDPADATKQLAEFYYNGTKKASLNSLSVFRDKADAAGPYKIGFDKEGYNEDGTWYVISSCVITRVAED